MPDWMKQHIPVVILFILTTYINLQTLDTKFTFQETRAAERYRLQVSSQKTLNETAKQVDKLTSTTDGLATRITNIEVYVPKSIMELEGKVMLLGYKIDEGKPL